MKTTHDWNLNSIQDSDALGVLAKCRQAEIRQNKSAVSLQLSSRPSRIPHFTWRRELVYAVATAIIIAIVVAHSLG